MTIKPDAIEIITGLSGFLTEKSRLRRGKAAQRLLQEAEELLAKGWKLDPAETSYNYACFYSINGDEEKCKEYLEYSCTHGTLPDREHLIADKDLEFVQEKDWFKEFLEKAKSRE